MRSLPLLQESVASVLPMTIILVSVLLRIILEWMGILRLMLQTPIADHNSSRGKTLDREDGSQLLALAANQKPACVARVCGIRSSNDHHTSACPSSPQSGVDEHPGRQARCSSELGYTASCESRACLRGKSLRHLFFQSAASILPITTILVSVLLRNNLEWMSMLRLMLQTPIAVIRGVHDVATDTSADTRKMEGKLDALVNLVTHLAANQKPASVARVCGIRPSNDHYTSVCPSSQQSGMDELPEASAANTYSRPPQQ
ncbi:hypothetical protein Fmac_028693 [Flemingia macrophylla]|uniref:Uncharacterized protein n=1 Tax=Flemingia macrophylla TaxID=520843 RepID=A0ABD1L884_9FABA